MIDLASICLATQQSLALNRLACYEDGYARIRQMLGGDRTQVRRRQLFVWQAPIMLLNIGVLLFVAGLVRFILSNAGTLWTTSDIKVCDNLDVTSMISTADSILWRSSSLSL